MRKNDLHINRFKFLNRILTIKHINILIGFVSIIKGELDFYHWIRIPFHRGPIDDSILYIIYPTTLLEKIVNCSESIMLIIAGLLILFGRGLSARLYFFISIFLIIVALLSANDMIVIYFNDPYSDISIFEYFSWSDFILKVLSGLILLLYITRPIVLQKLKMTHLSIKDYLFDTGIVVLIIGVIRLLS